MSSPLSSFNRCSINELIEEGVHMVKDNSLDESKPWAIWMPEYDLIRISPTSELEGKSFEDAVIVHEWMHAYEDLILNVVRRFRETQIDWWTKYHITRDNGLADYIRKHFKDYGF